MQENPRLHSLAPGAVFKLPQLMNNLPSPDWGQTDLQNKEKTLIHVEVFTQSIKIHFSPLQLKNLQIRNPYFRGTTVSVTIQYHKHFKFEPISSRAARIVFHSQLTPGATNRIICLCLSPDPDQITFRNTRRNEGRNLYNLFTKIFFEPNLECFSS